MQHKAPMMRFGFDQFPGRPRRQCRAYRRQIPLKGAYKDAIIDGKAERFTCH
ncbi:hypothetical protein FC75_GL001864 [Lacticaseibacillus camelliae DSM 22697 = JCM 13995]|uniref:Uncharacterized protein n=1 Tax=Lacticaseibacillus camelliae DSM 22697 = JCM 13995 TaxID=1423730 RepID=A0A0R2F0R6_9LACO|nr:hypothetical protein FC75_GL001864 [Lacticaseibacillus camelliae DSM 22697 = JCM 13995]